MTVSAYPSGIEPCPVDEPRPGVRDNRSMPEAEDTRAVDVLGAPYSAETLELPSDDEGEVVATLVSRRAAESHGRAVLHVHGFADYFFQTVAADWWVERGYDFYALDLRKYGR